MPAALGAPLAAVRWRPFRLPLRRRFEAASSALDDRSGVLLELVDEHGFHGVGEASPHPAFGDETAADVLRLLEGYAAGIEAGAAPPLPAVLFGQAGLALSCAFDVAALDLAGRRLGRRVSELLVRSPASSVETNAVIGGGSAEAAAEHGRAAVAAGYRTLKLKVGASEPDEELRRVEALRAACPDVALRLDANGAWSGDVAAALLPRFAALGVELVEQPVAAADLDGLLRLRGHTAVAVAADEAAASPDDARRVIEAAAADVLVLKPMQLGGLQPALEIARQATERGLRCLVTTTFDSSVGIAAALHLAAALPEITGDLTADVTADITADATGDTSFAHGLATGEQLAGDLVRQTLLPRAGRLDVPAAPGLGVEVDPQRLEEHATGPWRAVGREPDTW